MNILIIEDEFNLADAIKSMLKKENYIIKICTNGTEGEDEALSGIYDLILLDVMLPGKNGFEILKSIRKENINSKVIMLTAKANIDDKMEGFNEGANDYLTKPFHMDELFARTGEFLREVAMPLVEQGKDVLIVGHGAMNSSIICQVKNKERKDFWSDGIKNCKLMKLL